MLNYFAQTYNSYNNSTNYDYQDSMAQGYLIFMILALVIWFVVYAYAIVCMWKIFTKAGQPGWKALIPGYNSWVYAEISGKPGWWGIVSFGAFIPFIGFIFSIVGLVLYVLVSLDLAKKFGKDSTFAIVGLVIFSLVGIGILAFGDSKYKGNSLGAENQPPAPTPPIPPAAPIPPASTPPPQVS